MRISARWPTLCGIPPLPDSIRNNFPAKSREYGQQGFRSVVRPAWSPRALRAPLLSRLLGDGKTVWRGGYQISYDPLFTQALSLQLAPSSPNSITTRVV